MPLLEHVLPSLPASYTIENTARAIQEIRLAKHQDGNTENQDNRKDNSSAR